MRKFFGAIFSFIGKAFPYALLITCALVFLGAQTKTTESLKDLQAQVSDMELQQATEYAGTIKVEETLLAIDEAFIVKSDKDKAEAQARENVLLKVIYGVDKSANDRSNGIVTGVNKLVDGFNYALQKPSYDYLKSVTVRIIAREIADPKKGWIGTGVIVGLTDDSTIILTNRHVMPNDGLHNFYVVADGAKYPLLNIKVSTNDNVDLSLCVIQGHINGKRAVRGLADTKPQAPVYMVGQNLGRPDFYAEGTVSGFDPNENDELVVGMPVGPGNSGSGIIDKDGRLVGLLYAGTIIGQDTIFGEMDIAHGLCVPSKAIRLFIAEFIG